MGIAAFLVAWGAAVALTPQTMLPGPVAVFKALQEIAIDGVLFEHMAASLFRVALGYLAAVVVALPVGLALGWWKRAETAVTPMTQIFRPISPLACIPTAILWFRVDNLTAIFLSFVASSLPIMVAVMSAVHHILVVNLRAGRNFGLNGLQLMRHVIYPAVMPRLLVGLRLALGISWIVVVAAE